MNGERWAERLTPLTAGMAISLLVVAVVVNPAQASNTCTQCLAYWQHRGETRECKGKSKTDGTPPYHYDSSYNTCISNLKYANCAALGKPCTDPKTISTDPIDCGSTNCNFYPDLEIVGVSICSETCWNKQCITNGIENFCADRQKICDGSDGSQQCSECRCNP